MYLCHTGDHTTDCFLKHHAEHNLYPLRLHVFCTYACLSCINASVCHTQRSPCYSALSLSPHSLLHCVISTSHSYSFDCSKFPLSLLVPSHSPLSLIGGGNGGAKGAVAPSLFSIPRQSAVKIMRMRSSNLHKRSRTFHVAGRCSAVVCVV